MYRVKSIDIGLTNRCNAMCSQCTRVDPWTGKVKDWLNMDELSLEDIKTILPPNQLKYIEFISLCGTYGDVMVAKDVKEIIEYFYECNPKMLVSIATNGSMFDNTWWYDLARRTKGKRIKYIFGIDGVTPEQHARYRVGTNLDKIFEHASIVKMYGASIEWQYLVFDYNQQDIPLAEKMATEKHFDRFFTLYTNRDVPNDDHVIPEGTQSNMKEQDNSYEDSVNYVSCIFKKNDRVHINSLGYVLPCCYLDHEFMMWLHREDILSGRAIEFKPEDQEYIRADVEFFVKYGDDIFDGKKHTLQGVVNHKWWDELQERIRFKPLNKCRKICGIK